MPKSNAQQVAATIKSLKKPGPPSAAAQAIIRTEAKMRGETPKKK